MQELLETNSREFLEKLTEAVLIKENQFIIDSLSDLHAADISLILEEMDIDECKYILHLLDIQLASDIISNLDTDMRADFLETYSPSEIANFLEYCDSDDAVDILKELPLRLREQTISNLPKDSRSKDFLDLLFYEEGRAGALMAKELIKANVNWTMQQCIEEIRRQAENVDKIHTIYVVDDADILLGRISIKELLLSPANTIVGDIVIEDIEQVEAWTETEEVADIMQKYDLEVIPVVNTAGMLLGRITIDDVLDVITSQAEKDQQIMSGLSGDVEEDDTIFTIAKARLPWLVIGMFGGLLGAQFMGVFEQDLALIPAMAFFIPLITATGGNVGIQSSTIIVQTLANSSAFEDGMLERLLKVLLVSLLNAAVIAVLVLSFNLIMGNELSLALVVSIALFAVVVLASLMGTITPIVLDKFNINPALASGPFITTANDLMGLAIYFLTARLLFSLNLFA